MPSESLVSKSCVVSSLGTVWLGVCGEFSEILKT